MKRQNGLTSLFADVDQYDPQFLAEMKRLHHIFVLGRWGIIVILWFVIGVASLWALRQEFTMLTRHFTWAALRYGLAFHPLSTLGLSVCIGPTVALLVWQTRNILWGLPRKEVLRLEKQVAKIREQGKTHPLWQCVCINTHSSSTNSSSPPFTEPPSSPPR